MRLIDADKLPIYSTIEGIEKSEKGTVAILDNWVSAISIEEAPTVEAITVEQLLSILPKYDDYIHTKTYPYSQTMEDIYSKGYEDGWGACLKAIKEELDVWEKENEIN